MEHEKRHGLQINIPGVTGFYQEFASIPKIVGWRHVVWTISDGVLSFYVDGILRKEALLKAKEVVFIKEPYQIMRKERGKSFNGRIENISIYTKAMTHRKVVAHLFEFQDKYNIESFDIRTPFYEKMLINGKPVVDRAIELKKGTYKLEISNHEQTGYISCVPPRYFRYNKGVKKRHSMLFEY